MDKSLSDSDLSTAEKTLTVFDLAADKALKTPPNFFSHRAKRPREDCCSGLDSFKDEMINTISALFSAQTSELKTIAKELKDIKQTNLNIENSVEFLSQQNEELHRKINQMELQSTKDREYIHILEDRLEDLQRNNRKTCLEIKNVPKKPQENKNDLVDMVVNLSKNIDCEIQKSEIRDVFRVQGKRDGPKNTPIIVETSSTMIKTGILKACKSYNIKNKEKLRAKVLNITSEEETPIFVSEQLTAKGARLYFLARELHKTKQYKFCWTSFGKVYVRRDENSPVILINHESQITQLMQKI